MKRTMAAAFAIFSLAADMDDPDRLPRVGASSVPALVKAMNVVTLGREA